jgi:uncharacterized protein (TIGR00730 family)
MKSVVVYCGSRVGRSSVYKEAAVELGTLLVEEDITLVYGGGRVGLMGIVADTVMRNGGRVIGVIPEALNIKEVENTDVTELYVVRSMHERKLLMSEKADGAIVLPGGFGTLDELFEFVTWTQLGIHSKPAGVLNIHGYFDNMIRFLDHVEEQHFLSREHRQLLISADTPRSLLESLKRAVVRSGFLEKLKT